MIRIANQNLTFLHDYVTRLTYMHLHPDGARNWTGHYMDHWSTFRVNSSEEEWQFSREISNK